jgi:hypothetical protein
MSSHYPFGDSYRAHKIRSFLLCRTTIPFEDMDTACMMAYGPVNTGPTNDTDSLEVYNEDDNTSLRGHFVDHPNDGELMFHSTSPRPYVSLDAPTELTAVDREENGRRKVKVGTITPFAGGIFRVDLEEGFYVLVSGPVSWEEFLSQKR